MNDKPDDKPRYTCTEYRMEMILLSLERKIHHPDISEKEKQAIEKEIEKIKEQMEMT